MAKINLLPNKGSIPLITFGFHSIIAILLYSILFSVIYKVGSLDSFVATLKTFIILVIYEIVFINLFLHMKGMTTHELMEEPVLKSLAMFPQIIFVFLTGLIWYQFMNKKKIEEKVL